MEIFRSKGLGGKLVVLALLGCAITLAVAGAQDSTAVFAPAVQRQEITFTSWTGMWRSHGSDDRIQSDIVWTGGRAAAQLPWNTQRA